MIDSSAAQLDGRYLVDYTIHTNESSTVYRATELATGRVVAVNSEAAGQNLLKGYGATSSRARMSSTLV